MHNLNLVEIRSKKNITTKNLAEHLVTRMHDGKVVIIHDRPLMLLSLLRKQWLRIGRNLQKQRSSTIDQSRVRELSQAIFWASRLRFTTKWTPEDFLADVHIATPEQVRSYPPDCRTLYIMSNIDKEQIYTITGWMRSGGMVVKWTNQDH